MEKKKGGGKVSTPGNLLNSTLLSTGHGGKHGTQVNTGRGPSFADTRATVSRTRRNETEGVMLKNSSSGSF